MQLLDRRELIALACAVPGLGVARASASDPKQKFPAGIVPGGRPGGRGPNATPSAPPPASPTDAYWQTCDECKELGVHHIEINNTHRKIVEAYESRIPEFKDEMAKRGLTLLGSAMYSHLHITEQRQQLIDMHVRVARFLKATGGVYMNPLIAPGGNLGNGTDAEYREVNVKAWAANANAIGKRVREETGIKIGLHPEQGDIRAGIIDAFMDATDPKAFNLWLDIGHFVACGLDPQVVLKKYYSRIIGLHLRDFRPPEPDQKGPDGQPARGRMVPFGQGVIPLKTVVGILLDRGFTGPVMGEGGGNKAMRDYMSEVLQLKL